MLAKHHVKNGFECDKPALTNYTRNIALQHQQRGLGRTYVAVYDDSPTVIGYYTLAASKVSFESWPTDKRMPPNMSVPTILLGKLAVDNQFKGRKLGEFLLLHAMWRAEQTSRQIGAVALEVDVLDSDALGFYEKYDLQVLADDPLHMYITVDKIRQLALDYASVTRS